MYNEILKVMKYNGRHINFLGGALFGGAIISISYDRVLTQAHDNTDCCRREIKELLYIISQNKY